MRFKLILICGAIYGLVMGVWKTYEYFANPTPTSISVAAFNRQQPEKSWLHFTNAQLDFENAISLQTILTKADRGIVIPVRDRSDPAARTSVALYISTDKAEELVRQIVSNPADPAIASEVEGMVMTDLGSEPDKIRRVVQKNAFFSSPIALIRHGEKPNGRIVIGIDGAILVGIAVLIVLWRRSRQRAQLPPVSLSVPPPLPPQAVK